MTQFLVDLHLPPLLAHETWFTSPERQDRFDWSFALQTLPLALLAAAVVVTVLVRLIARRWPGVDVPFLSAMAPYMPFAVRMHLAISLIGLLSLGYYLSPAMPLSKDPVGVMLGAVMVLVAVGMATGWHTRYAALLLIAAGPLGMLEFGFWPVAQRLDVLALAICVLVWGAGRWSADYEQHRTRDPSSTDAARAIWILRIGVGGALIVVAFAEKLANPELALHFLDRYPHFNVARQTGLPMGDETFITIAGVIEVLFGLLIISGALPQLGVLIVGVPFNATLWFFGSTELVGHLPVYGSMLALLVYGSHPTLRPLVGTLWPWSTPRRPPSELEPSTAQV